jgi:hypothetical protein
MELDYALPVPVAAYQFLAIVGYIIPIGEPVQVEHIYA